MKKTYTKKQITEAIAYWKKKLNEASYDEVVQYNSVCDSEFEKISSMIDDNASDQDLAWMIFSIAHKLAKNANNVIFKEIGQKVDEIGRGYMI